MRGKVHGRDFKLSIARQLVSGQKRLAPICREHNLIPSMVTRWRQEYEAQGEAAFAPKELAGMQALEVKMAELEHFCGQLTMENAILKKALHLLPSNNHTR